ISCKLYPGRSCAIALPLGPTTRTPITVASEWNFLWIDIGTPQYSLIHFLLAALSKPNSNKESKKLKKQTFTEASKGNEVWSGSASESAIDTAAQESVEAIKTLLQRPNQSMKRLPLFL